MVLRSIRLGRSTSADAGKDRALMFDAEGNLLVKWEQKGSGEGEFSTMGLGRLAVDANDNVFVVDNGNL